VRSLKSYYARDVAARLREQGVAQEMRLAREMQEASLPAAPPQIPGLDCAYLTRSAGEVGVTFFCS
jgi:serine phosphatase RsbU (regulator of sigma subunit)